MAGKREDRARRERAAAAARRANKSALKGRERKRAASTAIAERQRVIGQMHLERIPQFEIAERLKITEAMVSRDLKAIREEWRAEARSDVGEATERELKSLAASERRLRSEIERIKPGANIALLCKLSAEIVRIQTHRARLLGLEAPTKLVHQGPDGKPIQHDVTARGPDAATLDEERALRALTPEARRAVLARARAEVEGAARGALPAPTPVPAEDTTVRPAEGSETGSDSPVLEVGERGFDSCGEAGPSPTGGAPVEVSPGLYAVPHGLERERP